MPAARSGASPIPATLRKHVERIDIFRRKLRAHDRVMERRSAIPRFPNCPLQQKAKA
jgi:hypothetical protein